MRRNHPEADELSPAASLPADPATVIEALGPLLEPERAARIDAVVAARTRSIIPVLEAVDDPRNVAAVLRSADAFGLQEVHLIEGEQPFLASRRVTQGAELWLDLVRYRSAEACVAALRERGFQVYVATMRGDLVPEDLHCIAKLAVVFGNEHAGTSRALHQLCDGSYAIPMHGFAQSLNVSVAAAITLHAARQGRPGDLSPEEQAELRARFLMHSVPRSGEVVTEHLRRRTR
ncbi:MAG: TrmH family RNA methyltransferase [Polyangiales bacterium]